MPRMEEQMSKRGSRILTASISAILYCLTCASICHTEVKRSQPQYAVKFKIGVKVPMQDGVNLSADIYRPDAPGKFPALLLMTPYNNMAEATINQAVYFAERGYAVALVDLRGRHDSEGKWDPYVNDPHDG